MMRSRRRGYSLVPTAAFIALSGTLLAVFIPPFLRAVRLSHTSEAGELLARMHAGASAYYLAARSIDGQPHSRCLPAGAGPTPLEPRATGRAVAFGDDATAGYATWKSLAFEADRPVRFRYTYAPVQAGCELRAPEDTYLVRYIAEGDLDEDGHRSWFERRDTALETGLSPIGVLYVRDRVE